jgi:two-component system, NarL family, invasion response regulator UvrY
MTDEVRVLVVDDSAVFLKACRNVIEATERFRLAGTAASGEEAVEQAIELEPDLVLMDVRMPGIGGVEAAARIHALLPETTLVMLTADSVEPESEAVFSVVHKRSLSPAALEELWRRRERERDS